MIKVTIFKKDRKYVGFNVEGHANYAESGKDIVCAAVSTLTCNAENSICEFTHDYSEHCDGPGFTCLLLDTESNPSWECELLLKSFESGVRQISEQYPEYVTVKEAEA